MANRTLRSHAVKIHTDNEDFTDGKSDCAVGQRTVLGSYEETNRVDLTWQQRVELGFPTVVTESGRQQPDIGESKVADVGRGSQVA
jgi:hypothetical protein